MRKRCTTTLLLAASLLAVAAASSTVCGQGVPWGWGGASTPTAQSHAEAHWSPELFADYIGTGQPPHPSVARIVAPEKSGTSLGSGVLVDVNRTQGLVLTNWHVIRDSRSAVLVQFPDGFQSAGTVVRWDEPWDLAVLVIWKPRATPVALALQPPVLGEQLTIAGYGRGPFRAETGPCTQYLSPGTGYPMEFVELSATARQGDSGGPILNTQGELAGVLFGQNDGRTIGSCSTRVRTFLASVGSKGFVPTPIGEFSDASVLARGVGTPALLGRSRLASASDETVQRSSHVAAPPIGAFPAADSQGNEQSLAPSPPSAHTLEDVLDLYKSGRTLLIALGGLALVALGLRTIFAGRE
ncbi:MAG: serine protease [Planctomycetota bacterium]